MPPLALPSPNEPVATPPKDCDSPTVTFSLPPLMTAATAVRPNCAPPILMLAAESRRSTLKSL